MSVKIYSAAIFALLTLAPVAAPLAAPLTPSEGNWTAAEFQFNSGEKMKGLRIHYTTLGSPDKPAVLLLHGTNQPIKALLADNFGGRLFGPGQPLDSNKYFIIMPDSIGSGQSSKPSDGLRMAFPQFDYGDMVTAQYRLLTEGLGIRHLRLVMGYSMGGMQTWLWGEKYPTMMDQLVPMAAQPAELSGRNWMMRRLLIESIKGDPAWQQGNYQQQPPALKYASTMFSVATTGGTLGWQQKAPTRAAADQRVEERLAAPVTADANDFIYLWGSSANYNAQRDLSRIKAPLLIVNSADDERNPPETGSLTADLKKLKRAELLLIPTGKQTSGHGTMMSAALYEKELNAFLKQNDKK
ncbi:MULTISPECIES: alpha/beta fold hydrolase [unclassified Erwinia]|uniref:alpha/beta fold hydrolase n=1 Tax=unclassified Erwinia TaxID=2622719 RepID=UPI0006F7DE4F|nr:MULTISPECIES: alpha/beta fold hydrolase [unclassified Erwinia]KQN54336.1 hypothetical protein ASF13_12965 [Erwinia sp. Leaf53]PLV49010.1 hypothetical protein NV64_20775 [Erwinia sp. B116]